VADGDDSLDLRRATKRVGGGRLRWSEWKSIEQERGTKT
jgi:hypothetical protein